MSVNMKDTIAELDRIGALVERYQDLGRSIDRLKSQNEIDGQNIYREFYPSLPKAPAAFDTLEPEVGSFSSSRANGVRISVIGLAVSVAVWLIAKVAEAFQWQWYAVWAMIVFVIWFIVIYPKYATDKTEYDHKLKRRNNFREIITNGHAQDVVRFQTDLNDYYARYQLFDHKLQACFNDYVSKHNSLVDDIEVVEQEINAVTLLSGEHIVLAKKISDALKSGRADTLKEGLNLVIAEQRDEEFKAQQLAEEARRTQIAEQQAYENRLHNQRMEREAAAQMQQAQTQARIAEAQLKATEQQNKQLKQLLDSQNRR